jgi:hypothetical protein
VPVTFNKKVGINLARKVAGGQDYEVQYEKDKMGVSGKEIKAAVKTEGNSRKKVEKKLNK